VALATNVGVSEQNTMMLGEKQDREVKHQHPICLKRCALGHHYLQGVTDGIVSSLPLTGRARLSYTLRVRNVGIPTSFFIFYFLRDHMIVFGTAMSRVAVSCPSAWSVRVLISPHFRLFVQNSFHSSGLHTMTKVSVHVKPCTAF
jgi:hypothetical protein